MSREDLEVGFKHFQDGNRVQLYKEIAKEMVLKIISNPAVLPALFSGVCELIWLARPVHLLHHCSVWFGPEA